MDSIASKHLQAVFIGRPRPRTPPIVTWPLFAASQSAAAHLNEYSGRIDYNLSMNDRLFGRWSQQYEQKINFPTYYGELPTQRGPSGRLLF